MNWVKAMVTQQFAANGQHKRCATYSVDSTPRILSGMHVIFDLTESALPSVGRSASVDAIYENSPFRLSL